MRLHSKIPACSSGVRPRLSPLKSRVPKRCLIKAHPLRQTRQKEKERKGPRAGQNFQSIIKKPSENTSRKERARRVNQRSQRSATSLVAVVVAYICVLHCRSTGSTRRGGRLFSRFRVERLRARERTTLRGQQQQHWLQLREGRRGQGAILFAVYTCVSGFGIVSIF